MMCETIHLQSNDANELEDVNIKEDKCIIKKVNRNTKLTEQDVNVNKLIITNLKIEIDKVDNINGANVENVYLEVNKDHSSLKNMFEMTKKTIIKREVKTETEIEDLKDITHTKDTDSYEPKIIEIRSLVSDEYFKQHEAKIDQNNEILENNCVNGDCGVDTNAETELSNNHEIEIKIKQFDNIYYDSVDLDNDFIEVKSEDEESNKIENAVQEITIKIDHPDSEQNCTDSSITKNMLENSRHEQMEFADDHNLKENEFEYYDDTNNIVIAKAEAINGEVSVHNILSNINHMIPEDPKKSENVSEIIDSSQNDLEESEPLIIKIESIEEENFEHDQYSCIDKCKIIALNPDHSIGAGVEINEGLEVEPEFYGSTSQELDSIDFVRNDECAIMVKTIKDDNFQFLSNATNNKINRFQSESGLIVETEISGIDYNTQSDDKISYKTFEKNCVQYNITKAKNSNHIDVATNYESFDDQQNSVPNTNTHENKLEALIKKFNIDQEDFDDQDDNNVELTNRKVDNPLNIHVIFEASTNEYEIISEEYNKHIGHTGPEKLNNVCADKIQNRTSIEQLEGKAEVEDAGKPDPPNEQNFDSKFVKPSRPNTPPLVETARSATPFRPGTPAVENEMSLKSLLDLYTDDINNRLDDNSKPLIWPPPSLEDSQLEFPVFPAEKLHCVDCKGKFSNEYDIATHSCKNKYTDFTEFNKSIKKRKTFNLEPDDPDTIKVEELKSDRIEGSQKYIRRGVDIGPYKCPICSKSVARRSGLKIHIKRHQNTASYTCEYCPKSFVTLYDLDRHMFTHTKTKGFRLMCEICRKPFVSRDGLNQHKIIAHSGYAAYQCDICNRSYSQEYRLWRHKKTQHDFGSEVKQANVIEESLELLDDLEKPPHERNLKLIDDKMCNDEPQDISAKTTVLVKTALIRKSKKESKSVQVSRSVTPNIKIEDIEPMDIDLSDLKTLSLDMADIIEGNIKIKRPKPVSPVNADVQFRNHASLKYRNIDTFENKTFMIGCKTNINVQHTLKIESATLPSTEIEIDDIRRELGIEIVDSLPAKDEIIQLNLNKSQRLNDLDNVTTTLDNKKPDSETSFTDICELRREFGIDTIDTCTENDTFINLNSGNDDLGTGESDKLDTTGSGFKTVDLKIDATNLSLLDETLTECNEKENNNSVVKENTKANELSSPRFCASSEHTLFLNDMLTFNEPSNIVKAGDIEVCHNSSDLINELFDFSDVLG